MKKLVSRKFWIAVATVVSGILMMFGFGETSIEVIGGAIVTLGGAVGYMIAEGVVDSKKIGVAMESAATIVEEVTAHGMTDKEIDESIL